MPEWIPRISNAEFEVLTCLWSLGGEATSAQLLERLEPKQGWKLTTILTFLSRLTEKGIVRGTRGVRGRPGLYSAVYTQADLKCLETSQFLDTVHGGSVRSLITALCAPGKLAAGELEELRQFFTEEAAKADKGHD